MKIVDRQRLNEILSSKGIIKSPHYDKTAEYDLLAEPKEFIAIEDVKAEDKDYIVDGLLKSLLKINSRCYLLPKLTYFNTEEEGEYFRKLGMESLRDEGIEWTWEDLALITKIVSLHFVDGWHVGWDLYIAPSDGSFLILVCHHDEIHVEINNTTTARKFSELLTEAAVDHELFESD